MLLFGFVCQIFSFLSWAATVENKYDYFDQSHHARTQEQAQVTTQDTFKIQSN